MPKRFLPWSSVVACILVLLIPIARSQMSGKKKVSNQSDLPRFTYSITGSASDLVQADAANFKPFSAKVKTDLDSIFRNYDIEDKATLRTLLTARVNLQAAAGENQLALETIESLLKLGEKPTDSLETKVAIKPALQAALETNSTSGPAFDRAYRKYFREASVALPLDVGWDTARNVIAGSTVFTSAALIGEVKADFDPAIQKSGVLDNRQAWALIHDRNALLIGIPLNEANVEILRQYIAAHKAQQTDIWQAREVTLASDQKLTPVAVAIWDTGVDVSLFPDQLFSDPNPTATGKNALPFDDNGNPSTSWLFPLTAAQQRLYPDLLSEAKGMQDLRGGIDSPEAEDVQKRGDTLTADQHRGRESRD